MGTEYRGTFRAPPQRRAVEEILRARPTFSRFEPTLASYQLRFASNASVMPNVEVRIVIDEAETERVKELYVCDYGDDGTILRDLESSLELILEELD